MKASEHTLKVSGTIEIDEETAKKIAYQQDYVVSATGTLVKIEEYDQNDGTVKKRYSLKLTAVTIEE